MFSHACVGISDFERSLAFYMPPMDCLGLAQRFCDKSRPWAAWESSPGPRPLFIIGAPYDGQPHVAGNGQMLALLTKDRETVRRAFAIALQYGGSSEGEPGLRPQYHDNYYGAYFRDPDGNKLCVVCHSAEEAT